MSASAIHLQKDVIHRLVRLGVDLRDLDVLVIHDHVVLTGKLYCRQTSQPLCEMEINRIKQALYRIPGISGVRYLPVKVPLFV